MNYTDFYSEELTRKLKKLKIKDQVLFQAILRKIDEKNKIVKFDDFDHHDNIYKKRLT